MNLLLVTPIFPPEIGGPASYTFALSQKLVESGHQVAVITFCQQPPQSVPGVKIHWLQTTGNFLTRQSKLFSQVLSQAHQADVIYIQGTIVVGLSSVIAAKLHRKKTLLKFVGDEVWEAARNSGKTDQNIEDYYAKANSLSFLRRQESIQILLHRIILRQADHIIVPSSYLRDFLINVHRIPEAKITQINNPVEIQGQDSVKIQKNQNQLIYVGRLVKWKHVDQILEALALARQQKDWQLIIVGDGPELQKLKAQSEKLKLESVINFTGKLSKAATHQLIAQSAKLILYSDYEGQSHTIIEAMQLGTAVIASDIEPNRELGQDRIQLVKPNEPTLLAQAFNQPINQRELRQTDSWARDTFSWSKHLEKLGKLL